MLDPRFPATSEDLINEAYVGAGAHANVGSDTYGYYIATVDKLSKTIGIYSPNSHFARDWTDGTAVPDAFDPSQKPTEFLQAFRGKWHCIDPQTGKRLSTIKHLDIGQCLFYFDPSF